MTTATPTKPKTKSRPKSAPKKGRAKSNGSKTRAPAKSRTKAKAKQAVTKGSVHTVTLTVERPKERRCHFPCPNCEHLVYANRAKPRAAFTTQCRGCRMRWINQEPFKDGKPEDQKPGHTWKLSVKSA